MHCLSFVEIPYCEKSILISTYQQTVMPNKVHDCIFVGAHQLLAVSLFLEVPHYHTRIVGGTDTDIVFRHDLADTASESTENTYE